MEINVSLFGVLHWQQWHLLHPPLNAFIQNWNDSKGYAFPPFSLIGRILAKIRRDQASIIVVVPCWKIQPQFQQFSRMVEQGAMPMLLKVYHKLLQSPGTEQKHPFCKKLQLIVAYLSDVSKWKDCRQASMMSSWNHGDQCKSSLQQTSAEMVGILWKMGLPSPTSSCN